jgi:osmotically-inducible protein OsmY
MGLSTKFSNGVPKPTVTFGKANYTSTAQSATNQGAGGASTTTTATNYGTQPGTVRNPSYVTVLREDVPLPVYKSDVLFTEVRDVIARSSLLPSKNNIQVSVNENVVILSGLVASDRERVLAEGIVKMTPGVRAIQNQIQVKTK